MDPHHLSEYLQDIKRPGRASELQVFGEVIPVFARTALLDQLGQFFVGIDLLHRRMNIKLFNSLLGLLTSKGFPKEVVYLVRRFHTKKKELSQLSSPSKDSTTNNNSPLDNYQNIFLNEFSYNCAIYSLEKLGDISEMNNIYSLMRDRDILPNNFTFAILIRANATSGKIDRVNKYLEEMKALKIEEDDLIYTAVILGFSTANNFPK